MVEVEEEEETRVKRGRREEGGVGREANAA